MSYKTICVTYESSVLKIEIDQPDTSNAITRDFIIELNVLFDSLENDIKLIVITGKGKTFASGADLKQMLHSTESETIETARLAQKTFNRFRNLKIPVIAIVNGHAIGGGFELALACDFIIAASNAIFRLPEFDFNIMPAAGGIQRLVEKSGYSNTIYSIFSTQEITAEQAYSMNLVQKVVSRENLANESNKLITAIYNKPQRTIELIKYTCRKVKPFSPEESQMRESNCFAELFNLYGKKAIKNYFDTKQPQNDVKK